MRPVDADKLYNDMLSVMCGTGYQSLALSVIELAPTIGTDISNEPITMDELLEMDGEPV